MEKVVGYLRVSTQEQSRSGLSLEAQRAAIDVEVTRRGWTLVEVCEDAGFSGALPPHRRPALTRALELIEARRVGTLMVSRQDRLSRSIVDSALLLDPAKARSGRW